MTTSTMKHTGGPWQAKEFASPVGTFFISDSMGQLLFGAGKPLTEHNARLIAAAPELLSALVDLLDACPASCEDRRLNEAMKMAEKAIAKARG